MIGLRGGASDRAVLVAGHRSKTVTGDRWREFYAERDYDRLAYLAGEEMVDAVETFLDEVVVDDGEGLIDSFASVGCGPAVTELALARRHPEIDFHCYDVAETVVADNREIATEAGRTNVSFAVAGLPDLDLGRTFDVVYCVATLYFVADVERALETLFAHVAPGGYLIVTFPGERTREWADGHEAWRREFFEPVVEGVNLLTAGDVERVLDTSVADFWAAVDASAVDRDVHPAVYARR